MRVDEGVQFAGIERKKCRSARVITDETKPVPQEGLTCNAPSALSTRSASTAFSVAASWDIPRVPGADESPRGRRLLPSLTALQFFDAAARHLSFTRAAAELSVTQSAISRQIRQLENYAYFAKLTHAPYKRYVEIGEGTHNLMLEKNRMQLFEEVQHFLDENVKAGE